MGTGWRGLGADGAGVNSGLCASLGFFIDMTPGRRKMHGTGFALFCVGRFAGDTHSITTKCGIAPGMRE